MVLASNRDEFYERQGEPPTIREGENYSFLAPRDPLQGGTWMGINQKGVFMGLTNRLDQTPKPDAPSRGNLVRKLLQQSSSRKHAIENYQDLEPERYNPHFLLILDNSGITIFQHSLKSTEREDLKDGLFFLENRSGFIFNQDKLKKSLPFSQNSISSDILVELEDFCSSHKNIFDRKSICLHHEIAGTLSSGIMKIQPDTNTFNFRFSQGPPCENNYQAIRMPNGFKKKVLSSWRNQPEQ